MGQWIEDGGEREWYEVQAIAGVHTFDNPAAARRRRNLANRYTRLCLEQQRQREAWRDRTINALRVELDMERAPERARDVTWDIETTPSGRSATTWLYDDIVPMPTPSERSVTSWLTGQEVGRLYRYEVEPVRILREDLFFGSSDFTVNFSTTPIARTSTGSAASTASTIAARQNDIYRRLVETYRRPPPSPPTPMPRPATNTEEDGICEFDHPRKSFQITYLAVVDPANDRVLYWETDGCCTPERVGIVLARYYGTEALVRQLCDREQGRAFSHIHPVPGKLDELAVLLPYDFVNWTSGTRNMHNHTFTWHQGRWWSRNPPNGNHATPVSFAANWTPVDPHGEAP